MESAIVNCLAKTDEVLVVVSGKFGERWRDICNVYGLKKVHVINVPWGESVRVEQIKAVMDSQPIAAVLTQHCETSTGALHPVKEIAEMLKAYPKTILMVDAITAIGAIELKMDEWGVDVICAGSQKAFMMPTGLSFIALSEKAWKKTEVSDLPKYYFNLKSELKALEKGQTFFSSAVTHIRALNAFFNYLNTQGGVEFLQKRCKLLSKATTEYIKILGLDIFPQVPSPSLTVLKVPKDIDGKKLRQHIEDKYGVVFMGGQDELLGKIIRIGHLGYITNEKLIEGREALAMALNDFDFKMNQEQIYNAKSLAKKILEETL